MGWSNSSMKHWFFLWVLLCHGLSWSRADEPAREEGIFLTVANPITTESTNQLKDRLERAIRERKIRKVVFDFNPDGREASTREFDAAAGLARYIEKQHQVRSIGFVRAKVSRHSVLPLLACQELVMAPEATIGEVLPDQPNTLDEDEVRIYSRLAGKAREALVMKMLDRSVSVMEGRRNGSQWYFDEKNRKQAEADGVSAINPQPVVPAGGLGLFSAAEARKFQLCKAIRGSRQEVAELYQMPASSLREDPLMGRTPNVWTVNVRGPVNKSLDESLRRKIDVATRNGGNVIVLNLESNGGMFDVARDLADYLRQLQGPDGLPVITIAFVPQEAAGPSTFLALGCTEIVLGKDAKLGDFRSQQVQEAPRPAPPAPPGRKGRAAPPPPPPPPVQPVDMKVIQESLVQLAKEQGYSPVLFQALVDPAVEVYRVRSQKGAFERRFLTKQDLDADAAGEGRWVNEGLVKVAGQSLDISAQRWKDYGIARFVVDNPSDLKELSSLYGWEQRQVRAAGSDWLDAVANFLSDPAVAMFLVVLGVTCLILELKMPGVSVPGIIAAICFVLFFWSQTQMNGQFALLAVMLFLLGLVLIGVEVFILPGFGITGFSGISLVLLGLALATVDRFPQTQSEWLSLGSTASTFAGAMGIAVISALAVARYLPSVPFANRMILPAPSDRVTSPDSSPASGVYASLLGAVGTAATVLRPAGMARLGESYVDVVSEGAFIPAGARIQVVEIEGNRVVVKEI